MWHALIKDHLTQGNLQKTMLSNEKQSNLEKKNTWKYLFKRDTQMTYTLGVDSGGRG